MNLIGQNELPHKATAQHALKEARRAVLSADYEKGIEIYRAILKLFPGHVMAQAELAELRLQRTTIAGLRRPIGVITSELEALIAEQRYAKALELIDIHVSAGYENGQLWAVHGAVSLAIGDFDRAVISLNRALELKFRNEMVLADLAAALLELDKPKEALAALKKGLGIAPRSAHLINLMGNAMKQSSDMLAAVKCYREALRLQPDSADIRSNLATALAALWKLKEAVEQAEKSVALDSNSAHLLYNLGNIYKSQGELDRAIQSYQRAAQLDKSSANLHNNLGNALKMVGRGEEALEQYELSLAINPADYRVVKNMVSLNAFRPSAAAFKTLIDRFHAAPESEPFRSSLAFAIYRVGKGLGEDAEAFKYLQYGNEIRRGELNYSFESDRKLFLQLEKMASELCGLAETDSFDPQFQPIFIVGMPRSGTSLIEQIIAAHSKVVGLGELPFAQKIMTVLMANEDTALFGEKLRDLYVRQLMGAYGDCQVFTDKMPTNFLYMPMLAAAFPEAKFVHVYRNPAATCWSIYECLFSSDGLGFAYRLEDLANYYAQYVRIMKCYSDLLGVRIHHINYEALTENSVSEIKNLMTYLKLEKEDAVFSPHLNKRGVATASSEQVRHPIYRNSSMAWRRFEPFLQDHLKSIEGFRAT